MKKKNPIVKLDDGTEIPLTEEAVRTAFRQRHEKSFFEGEKYGRQTRTITARPFREQLPPLEPENLTEARKEIAAEWEKEFQFAENLRAALSLAIVMCDQGADLEEIRDMCQDALTDQASPKLRQMRVAVHGPHPDHDRYVRNHMQRVRHAPMIHETVDIEVLGGGTGLTYKYSMPIAKNYNPHEKPFFKDTSS